MLSNNDRLKSLLSTLRELGVHLSVDGQNLRYSAPDGALTADLRAELRAHKEQLITLLRASPPVEHIPHADRKDTIPLSFAQQRMWLLHQLHPEHSFCNLPVVRKLIGPLRVDALRHALGQLVRRHEVLRTCFPAPDGKPAQQLVPCDAAPISIMDFASRPVTRRWKDALEWAEREARRPINLASGPVFRASLGHLSDTEHVLVLVMHHIAFDGWSISVMLSELSELYEAFVDDREPYLPELEIQYMDFTVWQRGKEADGAYAEQLEYWKERLQGAVPMIPLPTDRPRPPVLSYCGACHWFSIPEHLTASLKRFAAEFDTTLFVVLLAAFKSLLARYSGLTDIVVGVPVAGRHLIQLESLIGCFVNTLAYRTDLGGEPSFREVVERLKHEHAYASANQEVPFERVIDALQPERDLSGAPLYQTLFAFQNRAVIRSKFANLEMIPVVVDPGGSKLDLTLGIQESETTLNGWWEYSTDIFSADTVARMHGHFTCLLESVVNDPDTRLNSIEMLPAQERAQILRYAKGAVVSRPITDTLHGLIHHQALTTPDVIAVEFAAQSVTYQQLEARANQLANHLLSRGVRPGDHVGLCMERSIELVVSAYAILKAGGAYLPLDESMPPARVTDVLSQSMPPVVVTTQHLSERVPIESGRLVLVDGHASAIAESSDRSPDVAIGPDDLAYVIFTSGSTGSPKGVMSTHRGICNRLRWMQEEFRLDMSDRILQKTPTTFDVSVWELFWPLMYGARLCIAKPGGHKDPTYLLNAIKKWGITTLHFVPSMLRMFLDEPGIEECRHLRRVVCSGEALSRDLQQQFFDRLSCELHNLYGPTEASIDVTAWQCRRDDDLDFVPIGRPITNTQTYVLDPNQGLCPMGSIGELYLGGCQLARGYCHRPEQTADCFVPDPFANERGARLYRTGDLVRLRSDGVLEYVGRTDTQVKVRGFRIELGDVEAAIRMHPAVRTCAVTCRDDGPGGKMLVAYVLCRDGQTVDLRDLTDFLHSRLPNYMVPSGILFLDSFPLTASGKIDRRNLPAPTASDRPQATYVPPRSSAEQRMASIWADILGLERVGRDDNFFELGGDSILGIQIVARARREGLDVSARHIFEHQTVAELTAVSAAAKEALPATQMVVARDWPLTPIQRWFVEQKLEKPSRFTQSIALKVVDGVSPAIVERAIETVIDHHEALRVRLEADDSEGRQICCEGKPVGCFRHVDLSRLSQSQQDGAISEHTMAAEEAIDLFTGNLVQSVYFSGRADGNLLFIAIHHIGVDSVSWSILCADLDQAIDQVIKGADPDLPATTSFGIWANRLCAYALEPDLERNVRAWRTVLEREPGQIRLDCPTGENRCGATDTIVHSLSRELTEMLLRDTPRAYRTDINEVFACALSAVLVRWTGANTVRFDVERHGREDLFEDVDISRTVGWFTSLYPVVLDVDLQAGIGERLVSVKEQLRRTFDKGIHYGILRYLSPHQDRLTEFDRYGSQVVFNYLGQLDQQTQSWRHLRWTGERLGTSGAPENQRGYLVQIDSSVENGQLRTAWSFSRDVLDAMSVQQAVEHYVNELCAVIEHCARPESGGLTPADFPNSGLSQEQLADVLAEIGPE